MNQKPIKNNHKYPLSNFTWDTWDGLRTDLGQSPKVRCVTSCLKPYCKCLRG